MFAFLIRGRAHREHLDLEFQVQARQRVVGVEQEFVPLDTAHRHDRREGILTRTKLVTGLDLALHGKEGL